MYRKFYSKDSAQQMKKHNKFYQHKFDSVSRANRKNEKLQRRAARKGIKTPFDTVALLKQYAALLPKDSAATDSLKNKSLHLAKEKALDNIPGEEKEKLQMLQTKYGLSPEEASSFLSGDSTARKKLKLKALSFAEKTGEDNLPAEERAKLEALQSKYGLNPAEAKQYLSGDSSARKKLALKGLTTAKEKSINSLPPGQRKQMESYQKEFGQYSPEVKQYLVFLKDSVDHMDTIKAMAGKRSEALASKMIDEKLGGGGATQQLNEYNKQLEEMKNTPQQYKKQLDDYKDPEKLKAAAKEKAQEQALEKFAAQVDKVQSLMSKMSKLKGKYSTLLNSNDLSTGIKAKSLEGRPLRERWVIGGNFNIVNTTPFMIDLSPQFGYRIDKKFQVGVSAIYRATFVDSVKVSNSISPERYGYSVFSSYSLILNIFAYGEFERAISLVKQTPVASPLSTKPSDPQFKQWTSSLLIGVGRKFSIHPKVSGTVLFLWNPLHENGKTPYHDAFIIKTGIHLSELGLMKKK